MTPSRQTATSTQHHGESWRGRDRSAAGAADSVRRPRHAPAARSAHERRLVLFVPRQDRLENLRCCGRWLFVAETGAIVVLEILRVGLGAARERYSVRRNRGCRGPTARPSPMRPPRPWTSLTTSRRPFIPSWDDVGGRALRSRSRAADGGRFCVSPSPPGGGPAAVRLRRRSTRAAGGADRRAASAAAVR